MIDDDQEIERLHAFKKKHAHKNAKMPALGEIWSYRFTPTGAGTISNVICNRCKLEECLTDFSEW